MSNHSKKYKNKNQSKRPSIEEEYYVGQEYIEDDKHIDVLLEFRLFSSGAIDDFSFWLFKKKTDVKKDEYGNLLISTEQKISRRLWYDIKNQNRVASEKFIIGYINKVFPKINEEIIKQKYEKGHILIKPFSVLDARGVELINKNSKERIRVYWPLRVSNFPPSVSLASKYNRIHIRDLIDALTLYFNSDYNECVRKLITSLENCFHYYHLKPPKSKFLKILPFRIIKFFTKGWFHKVVNTYVSYDALRKNIIFIYSIRNKIVHDKYRISYKDGWFCLRAIITVFYIYKSLSVIEDELKDYVFSLEQQFGLLRFQHICEELNLDEIELQEKESKNKKPEPEITIPEDFDEYMISRLKITNEEKSKL